MTPFLARADGVTVSEMDGDLFLVWPDSGEIFHLDQMAAGVWNALEVSATAEELTALFVEAFPDIPPDRILNDLSDALATMVAAGVLVETAPDSS